jgi:hypothetical protein
MDRERGVVCLEGEEGKLKRREEKREDQRE